MTTPEALESQGEQGINPLQVARGAFTNALLAENTQGLIGGLHTLEVELVKGREEPVRVYIELVTSARQAIERAKILEGEEGSTTSVLRGFEERYALTLENFTPQASAAVGPALPTQTSNLPSMTSAKGGEASTATRTRRTQSQTQTVAPESPEASTATQEETFSSFFRQKRAEAKLSQVKLGQAAGGISNAKISGLENGRQTVDLTGVGQLASALGLNEEDAQKALDLYNKQFPQNPQE